MLTAEVQIGCAHLDMQVDYQKTTSEIYFEVAMRSIVQSRSLEILSYQWYGQPSAPAGQAWVPRWDVDCADLIDFLPTWQYNACQSITCELTTTNSQLVLQGLRLDEISNVNSILAKVEKTQTSSGSETKVSYVYTDCLQELARIAAHDRWEYYDSSTGETKCRRATDKPYTHFADFAAWLLHYVDNPARTFYLPVESPRCDICNSRIISDHRQGLIEPCLVYTCRSCQAGDYDICLSCYDQGNRCSEPAHDLYLRSPTGFWFQLDDAEVRLLQAVGREGSAERFFGLVRYTSRMRLWFSTMNGYIGSGARPVQPGDVVAVLFGAKVPILLRPQTDGCYRLIGDCYVNGMMDGEAIELWKQGLLTTETFELC